MYIKEHKDTTTVRRMRDRQKRDVPAVRIERDAGQGWILGFEEGTSIMQQSQWDCFLPPAAGKHDIMFHLHATRLPASTAPREPAHRSMDQVSISRISDAKYILYMVLSKTDVAYLAVETATTSKVSEKQGMNWNSENVMNTWVSRSTLAKGSESELK